ncbi:hypothetical protein SKAU_G00213000 [Synaphobranchus kaupii]|uniref:Uncharacterized protein n=1 Tax=Synaphobranchus kaupii TaxID=118154 RepID=A0A9Q1IV80_SYNKA|nr:hypothetical protein SKAU_G00213000 [Synaphobranchus kaupii]
MVPCRTPVTPPFTSALPRASTWQRCNNVNTFHSATRPQRDRGPPIHTSPDGKDPAGEKKKKGASFSGFLVLLGPIERRSGGKYQPIPDGPPSPGPPAFVRGQTRRAWRKPQDGGEEAGCRTGSNQADRHALITRFPRLPQPAPDEALSV